MKYILKEIGYNAWKFGEVCYPAIGDEVHITRKDNSVEQYLIAEYCGEHNIEQGRCARCEVSMLDGIHSGISLCNMCAFRCPDKSYWMRIDKLLEGL